MVSLQYTVDRDISYIYVIGTVLSGDFGTEVSEINRVPLSETVAS